MDKSEVQDIIYSLPTPTNLPLTLPFKIAVATSPNLQVVVGIIFSIVNTSFGLALLFAYTIDTRKTLHHVQPLEGAEEGENEARRESLVKEIGNEILNLELEWKNQVRNILTMKEGKKRDRVKK